LATKPMPASQIRKKERIKSVPSPTRMMPSYLSDAAMPGAGSSHSGSRK